MNSDDKRANELIQALRASWPLREALGGFAEEHASQLAQAFDSLTQAVPNHQLKSVKAPLKEAAITLANGYLTEQSIAGGHRKLAELIDEVATRGSLAEVLLAAGCALHDDACNTKLLDMVNKDLAKRLTTEWGPGKANAVIEDMPALLYQPMKNGFNRGRMRLLDFYGSSTLPTWLRVIAKNQAIDRARVERKKEPEGDDTIDPGDPPPDPEREEILRNLVDVASCVAEELFKSLQATSDQQYNVAVMRLKEGYSNVEIAARLGCSKSAVTQFLDKVSRKFLELLSDADPLLRGIINEPSRKEKKWIEEAVHALIKADADDETADSPEARNGAPSES